MHVCSSVVESYTALKEAYISSSNILPGRWADHTGDPHRESASTPIHARLDYHLSQISLKDHQKSRLNRLSDTRKMIYSTRRSENASPPSVRYCRRYSCLRILLPTSRILLEILERGSHPFPLETKYKSLELSPAPVPTRTVHGHK